MANKIVLNNLEEMEYRRREAFNSLRNNLQFCGADLKTFLLTSCGQNEGKSTVSFELARSMANAGKKVVLVDADMRKSVMVARYQMQAADKRVLGLTHYLSKQTEIEDIIYETNIEGLDMVLTGPLSPNPTDLLEGREFEELLKCLEERYDAVIIDSPPLGLVIDAAVIAPKCDGVILIIESEMTSYRAAQEVKKQLEMAGGHILGTVLNKIPSEGSNYYSYYKYYGKYYGRYYGKYYGEYK